MGREIPPEVLAVSPVSSHPRHSSRGLSLPLNILALIISYVDDIADIARVTRTCRLMYYMTLPQLYQKVTLRSYPELRYFAGKPEGYGGASPFVMALSGLATSNSATLVKEFCVAGTWPETRVDEYLKGRVPDSTMLLAISLRVAVDKMTNMASFSWDLDTKPLKSIYQGLAARSSLTSLSIKFPSTRAPRPIVVIPQMPSLCKLRLTNIDPLCYPDDISLLLFLSKNLKDLGLHWSPRMRMMAEPSINLRSYFGRCLEAKYQIPVRHIALQNFYGHNTGDMSQFINPDTLQSCDLIDCFGRATSASDTGRETDFIDQSWHTIPEGEIFRNFKRFRISEPAEHHAKIIGTFTGLEELYFVSNYGQERNGYAERPEMGGVSPSSIFPPNSTPKTPADQLNSTLCKEYLHSICTNHASSMRRLLLHDRWDLSGGQISTIVSSCPNLEQLGMALSGDEPNAMRILAPFLKNIQALRILHNHWLDMAMKNDPDLIRMVSPDTPNPQVWKMPTPTKLKWTAIGNFVFRIGKAVQIPDEDGRLEWRREVWRASLDDVKDIEIWKLDCLEI